MGWLSRVEEAQLVQDPPAAQLGPVPTWEPAGRGAARLGTQLAA